ncbi:MAG: 30S ribosomal protein S6 [Opitutales bacterium]
MPTATDQRHYRVNFILDPREVSVELEEAASKIGETLTGLGATINETKVIGTRPLARVTDRHMPAGIYLQYDLSGEPTLPAAIKGKYRLDRSVDRIFIDSVAK